MANYTFNIELSGIEELIDDIDNIYKLFKDKSFKMFIAEKCLESVRKISDRELNNISDADVLSSKLDEYKQNHKSEIGDGYIEISNSTILTPDEMEWVSESTKSRYGDGLSIAHVIEYGTGLKGTSDEDWEVNVPSPSKHKDGTWTFIKDGILYLNQSGMQGRFIYLKLIQEVEKNFDNWVDEYLDERL